MLDDLDNPDDEEGIPVFCQEHSQKGKLIFKVEGARGLRQQIKPKNANANPKKPAKEIKPREVITFDNGAKAFKEM